MTTERLNEFELTVKKERDEIREALLKTDHYLQAEYAFLVMTLLLGGKASLTALGETFCSGFILGRKYEQSLREKEGAAHAGK